MSTFANFESQKLESTPLKKHGVLARTLRRILRKHRAAQKPLLVPVIGYDEATLVPSSTESSLSIRSAASLVSGKTQVHQNAPLAAVHSPSNSLSSVCPIESGTTLHEEEDDDGFDTSSYHTCYEYSPGPPPKTETQKTNAKFLRALGSKMDKHMMLMDKLEGKTGLVSSRGSPVHYKLPGHHYIPSVCNRVANDEDYNLVWKQDYDEKTLLILREHKLSEIIQTLKETLPQENHRRCGQRSRSMECPPTPTPTLRKVEPSRRRRSNQSAKSTDFSDSATGRPYTQPVKPNVGFCYYIPLGYPCPPKTNVESEIVAYLEKRVAYELESAKSERLRQANSRCSLKSV